MKEVQLKKGGVAFVDDEDYERVEAFGEWLNHNGYAVNVVTLRVEKGQRKTFTTFMHRLVMNASETEIIDHKNENGLTNLHNIKSNLRRATHSQNRANSKMNRNNTSGHRNIRFAGSFNRPWRVQFVHEGEVITVGCFPTLEDAIQARDKRVLELKGGYAKLD